MCESGYCNWFWNTNIIKWLLWYHNVLIVYAIRGLHKCPKFGCSGHTFQGCWLLLILMMFHYKSMVSWSMKTCFSQKLILLDFEFWIFLLYIWILPIFLARIMPEFLLKNRPWFYKNEPVVALHCCFYLHYHASCGTLLHILRTYDIFVYFALVPSHALGAKTSDERLPCFMFCFKSTPGTREKKMLFLFQPSKYSPIPHPQPVFGPADFGSTVLLPSGPIIPDLTLE